MAKNQIFHHPDRLELTVPSGTVSGNPVVVGQIAGVALTDRQADGKATVAIRGVFELSVQGETNADAGSAVAEGDVLYYDSPEVVKINKDTTGVRFGYALGAVASGATATIRVLVGY